MDVKWCRGEHWGSNSLGAREVCMFSLCLCVFLPQIIDLHLGEKSLQSGQVTIVLFECECEWLSLYVSFVMTWMISL